MVPHDIADQFAPDQPAGPPQGPAEPERYADFQNLESRTRIAWALLCICGGSMRSDHPHRSERLALRLTEEEAERIAKAVTTARVSLSDWCRTELLRAADQAPTK